MARPIQATPILKGKDAEKLIKEAEQKINMSASKQKEIKRHLSAYHSFAARLSSK